METPLSLDAANALIAAVLARGREAALRPLTVAVLDAGGHLVALQREDGASLLRPQIAIAKANGALALGFSSRRVAEIAADAPTFIATTAALTPNGIGPAAGGVLIAGPENTVIGAIGVSGDTGDQDEACALSAIAACGFTARPDPAR